ncbi:sigma-70 family RNA polymerase sigma factor [Pseudomaricurvus alkylphenolicus]|nr:sigma-70 family RNA polymerase sigma factor [Pseudomaricurvus alkylphenolicus]NIB38768.1 sigma-70 family RNA polymerase sigma factor [Pseudomaricurvus alkylphenolicus]
MSQVNDQFDREELERYRSDLLTYALARVKDRALAEDLVQESYVRLLAKDNPGQIDCLKGYLLRTIYNLSIDHFRSQKIRLMSTDGEAEIEQASGSEGSPEQWLSERELRARFESAYEALPEKQQKIFYFRRMEGQSTEQIASKFNISRRMVQKYMAKIVLHFHSYLQDDV